VKAKALMAAFIGTTGVLGYHQVAMGRPEHYAAIEWSRRPPAATPCSPRVDRGDDDGDGHERHHDHDGEHRPAGLLLQDMVIRVHGSDFIKVDKKGQTIAAATNTGCAPAKGDDVYLFKPNGSIQQSTTFDVTSCRWRGDFSVVGRFQVQRCSDDGHGHGEGE
jgi:hypothetical protein